MAVVPVVSTVLIAVSMDGGEAPESDQDYRVPSGSLIDEPSHPSQSVESVCVSI